MRRLCWRISDIYNGFRSLFQQLHSPFSVYSACRYVSFCVLASIRVIWLPQSFSAVTFTIFSLFRVPVRFVLCPCQHPRHVVVRALSYARGYILYRFPLATLLR
nr:MAG TPA: hypothetical protein [Caudoviricetes sp.]